MMHAVTMTYEADTQDEDAFTEEVLADLKRGGWPILRRPLTYTYEHEGRTWVVVTAEVGARKDALAHSRERG